MFTVHQVRYGLATNSSSTHSLMILPGGAEDHQANGDFGWNFFTCGSRKAKLLYAAIHLRDTMAAVAGSEVARTVAEAWGEVELPEDPEWGPAGHVDHQSRWTLPLDWEGKSVDRAFYEELKEFLSREDVVILGGNDNAEHGHPLDNGETFQLGIPIESSSEHLVCRKDGAHWVLFNRQSGTKIRMSFDEGLAPPLKASAPELVDIKITDYCPFNCSFCYQDSTSKGLHAEMEALGNLAWALGDLRVFEVALGGGEPTFHPKFVEILRAFRYRGIVPNFTTKNLSWLDNHILRPQILEASGAFAYSTESAEGLKKLAALRDVYGIPSWKINCQYVMGSTDLFDFENILEVASACEVRLTLLGYKTNGRGKNFEPKDHARWPEVLKEHCEDVYKIGIDTALAAEYQSQLSDLGVPKWCYEVEEGKFSMYIDAVTMKTGRSSYGAALAMRPLKEEGWWGPLRDEILAHFSAY